MLLSDPETDPDQLSDSRLINGTFMMGWRIFIPFSAIIPCIVPCRDKRMHRRPYLHFFLSPLVILLQRSSVGHWSLGLDSTILVGNYRCFPKRKWLGHYWWTSIKPERLHRSKGLAGGVLPIMWCAVYKKIGCWGSASVFQIWSLLIRPLSISPHQTAYYHTEINMKAPPL